MSLKRFLTFGAVAAVIIAAAIPFLRSSNSEGKSREQAAIELLNVSYDPTRELWQEVNEQFIARYEKETGRKLTIKQSHGGSSSQARQVIDGLDADVVTLALWSDTDSIRKSGLIRENWDERFPNKSLPYFSTIVFVVRKGNPRQIKDWPDLIKPGAVVVTPNPKTSGNGKLSFLAAWGSVIQRGGTDADARSFVAELYQHTPVLDTGARGSTSTFAQKGIGDVHLTWENEAHLEVREAHGELEIVYPPVSIRAEPYIAVVDANVDRKGTREAAEAYLKHTYIDEAQELIARHFYRPINPEVLARHGHVFQSIELFPVTVVAADFDDAQTRYFAEGAVFDSIYQPQSDK
jgi:sulfate transport system substrate-binding protein